MHEDQERRREPRRPCRKAVMLSLGYGLHGRATLVDVSDSGLQLRSNEVLRLIKPQRHAMLLNHPIRIMLPALVIEGEIVRVNLARGTLAARILQVSNQTAWSGLA